MADALDSGPFFHGTKAQLSPGDLLSARFNSNYRPEVVMNHIYFTALPDGAGLAAEVAALNSIPHVYEVEPTGKYENDPNVTGSTKDKRPRISQQSNPRYNIPLDDQVNCQYRAGVRKITRYPMKMD